MKQKQIFRQNSKERFEDAKILGGDPNGVINFNQTNHQWATSLYKKMCARTWFPGQINIAKDVIQYSSLTNEEKRTYNLVLSQLITNDSIQTNQLMDRINSYITSPVVNACISRQAFEESQHSESYSIMAEDIVKNTEVIYHMHEQDEELRIKNQSVEDMYESVFAQKIQEETDDYITIKKPSKEDILMAFVANQILEELVFPGGFAALLSLENKMPGTTENIVEIMKDESLNHVPLFMQIFRTTIKEEYNGDIPEIVVTRATEFIKKMTDAEKRWTKYATKGLLGFTDASINVFVEGRANSVCNNLGLPLIYPKSENNPLEKLLKKSLRGGEMESRSNFFEVNSVEYTKGSLQVNDEWDIS